jgi:hypothetical protein
MSLEEDDVPLQRRMRQFHSGGSTVNGSPLSGQQAPGAATAPQPDSRVAASTALGGSASTAREVSAVVAVTVKTRTTKETTSAKAAEEVVATKVVADKVVVVKAAIDKVVADKATVTKAAADKAAVAKATTLKTVDRGLQWREPPWDWWGSAPAPLLPRLRDPRERLCWAAPLLPLGSSAAPRNPDTQSNCVVAFSFSFICTVFDRIFCSLARLPLV